MVLVGVEHGMAITEAIGLAVDLTEDHIWASWGLFSDLGVWQPLVIGTSGENIILSTYQFQEGWTLDY